MDFAFSSEQEELRGWARRFLADRYSPARIAEIADGDLGFDPDAWPLIVDLGWLDEQLGFLDQAVLFEECGAALLPAPYLATVTLAGPALRADAELHDALRRGDRRATLAWAEPGVPHGLLDHDHATSVVEGGRLRGRKVLVPDATAVDLFVVLARDADGAGLHAVSAADARVSACPSLDGTRRLAEVMFDGAPARRLVRRDEVDGVLRDVRRRSLAGLACEAVGVARRVLELSVEHAGNREQFGRPIGVHQAVSHRLADVYIALEEARSLAYWAAWCVMEGDGVGEQACLAAKAHAGEAAVLACESAIQVHGGIGMTWEHVLHRYYKRARWIAAFEGAAREQRREIATALLD